MTSPTVPRQRRGWDIALSIVFMVLGAVGTLVTAFLEVFLVAFTDYCPPKTCHPDQGIAALSVIWPIVIGVLVVSIVLSIVFLVLGRRAWWIALIGFVVVTAGGITGIALYFAAVGGG